VLIARVPDAAWLASKLPNYTAAQFQATTGRSLTAELGNLYHCDYALLQASLRPPAARDTRWRETYLPAPVVLFWYHPGALAGSDLVPVAIQVDPPGAVAWDQPDPALPAVAVPPLTVTPADGPAWALAKTLVQSADQNHQVCSTHVGRTHWVVEPVALAVPRQLPPDHPLYLLLEPHIRYTLAVNDTTIPLITEQGRIFATIYAGTLEETRQIMKETHARWSLADLALEADLQARGMDGYPGHYPYREDARRLWQATREFVAEYLGIYYTTPSQVQGDTHLQAFLTELADPARGNLRGVAASSVPQLVELVAQILFICGPQHAAVHYPQLEYFTYVPASAGAAWRPPPLRAAEVAPDRTLATLPPTHHAVVQFQTDQIGDYRYDRYGDYRRYHLGNSRDPAVRAAVDAFGLRLRQVQQEIAQDNADPAKRPRPYVYLLPDNIPNSINI
jgi:arachidonate 15-lipoxygenase